MSLSYEDAFLEIKRQNFTGDESEFLELKCGIVHDIDEIAKRIVLRFIFWYIIAKTNATELTNTTQILIVKYSKSVFSDMRSVKQMTGNYMFLFYTSVCFGKRFVAVFMNET